jgi:hypothetical protein
MKNLITIAGIGWIIYALYKNQEQDKKILALTTALENANIALKKASEPKVTNSTYEVAMQPINPKAELFPTDIMVQKFDASKNATTSPAPTQVTI